MVELRIAVIDDWLNVARESADWSELSKRAEIVFSPRNFPTGSENEAAEFLADFDIIQLMRERTWFSARLLSQLPRLKMLSLTGNKAPHIDFDYCTRHGIVVSQAGSKTPSTKTIRARTSLPNGSRLRSRSMSFGFAAVLTRGG